MNLSRPLEEVQRTLEYAVEQSKRRERYRIADAYLEEKPAVLPESQLIQQRLQQIEMIRPFIHQLEELLSEPDLKALTPRLEKDWHLAIDRIADLIADQQIIDKFVERLQLLDQVYDDLVIVYKWVKSQTGPTPHFLNFYKHWTKLWQNFFDFHTSSANEAVVDIISRFRSSDQKQSAYQQ